MNIALLTTQTLHHTYFLRELDKAFPVAATLVETIGPKFPFKTAHPFEAERDEYEAEVWFNGARPGLSEFSMAREFPTVNSPQAVRLIKELRPDVVVVFGAGRLSAEVLAACPRATVNLHGGDPEQYRGLDSHLWAIYHNDFGDLASTLHMINERLDDGDIVLQADLPLVRGMGLHELRRVNTETCLRLALAALDMFSRFGSFISRRQRAAGRYYSAMPAELKEICKRKFEGRRTWP
ncbi:MAG: hypothetical protein JW718_08395 [Desulfovibrionaceae bacterium]|nr:hypothetical protein [Desulfovibrionaceae bacterium]